MPGLKADKELWKMLGLLMVVGAVFELVVSVALVGVFVWIL